MTVVDSRLPVLGICAGLQLLARFAGGAIDHMADGGDERGYDEVTVIRPAAILAGLGDRVTVMQRHTDKMTLLPDELKPLATGARCRVQALRSRSRPWWGTQFHPEEHDVAHPDGGTHPAELRRARPRRRALLTAARKAHGCAGRGATTARWSKIGAVLIYPR